MQRRDFLQPSRLTGDPFWAFARAMLRYRLHIAGCFVFVLISSVALGVGMAGVKPILDAILGQGKDLPALVQTWNDSVRSHAAFFSFAIVPDHVIARLPAGDPFVALLWIMAALLILTVIGASATFLHAYSSLTVVNSTISAIRRRAFRAVVHAPLGEILRRGASDPVSRIVNDSSRLSDGLNVLLSKTLLQGGKGVAGLLAALWFSWKVTLIALIAAPLLYTVIRKLGKRIRRSSGAAMECQGELTRVANESIQGLRVVKVHDAEVYETGRFHQVNKRVQRELNRVRSARALASPLTDTLTIAALSLLTLGAGRAILHSRLDPTDFILTIVALAVAGASLKPLTGLAHDIQVSTPAAERLRELIALAHEPGHERALPRLPRHQTGIEFQEVVLTYPGREETALRGVSLFIPFGLRVAFVGPNGCGKTSLLSLVTRLFDPDSGQVLIDGTNIARVSVRSLRRQIGVVSQETVLFRGSIRENIAYGTWSDDDSIIAAAKKARAHDFISRLPGGYDTDVSEQGLSLSGGQRQRIAIARAILRDPSILILDEATSMIDAESEAQISGALHDFSRGRTCLIVAHRLSTVVGCDRIVVMDQGRVIDLGTHEELLARCGLYQQLVRHQFPGATA